MNIIYRHLNPDWTQEYYTWKWLMILMDTYNKYGITCSELLLIGKPLTLSTWNKVICILIMNCWSFFILRWDDEILSLLNQTEGVFFVIHQHSFPKHVSILWGIISNIVQHRLTQFSEWICQQPLKLLINLHINSIIACDIFSSRENLFYKINFKGSAQHFFKYDK